MAPASCPRSRPAPRPAAHGGGPPGLRLGISSGVRRAPPQRRPRGSPPASRSSTGSLGYEDTVIPQLENAILAGHDIIFLGERGQAKTRIIRSLVELLDEWMPIVAGSRDQRRPLRPISRHARRRVAERGRRDADRLGAPLGALRREARHARHHDRRPHRRDRPDQGRRGPLPLRRAPPSTTASSRASTAASSPSTSCPTSPSGSRSASSTCSRSATSRSAATGSASPSTSCWSPRPTPRTTRTAAGSSPR